MDMTRPSTGNDQTEDPIKINHTEEVEEEHHESGATKMFKKVKARAKKIKTSLTKHGNDQEEDDDEDDGKDSPTRLPEEESETTPAAKEVPAKESDLTIHGNDQEEDDDEDDDDVKTNQSESLNHPRETNLPTQEETKPVLSSEHNTHVETEPLREEEAIHHVRTNSHVPTGKFAPDEDESLGGQREVNDPDSPKRLEVDQSGESNYQSKFTQKGDNFDSKSAIGKDSPVGFGGDSVTEPGKDFPARSFGFDQRVDSEIGEDSSADFPAKSYEFEQTVESGTGIDGDKPGTEKREDFLGKSYEFKHEIESGIGKDSPTRLPEEESVTTPAAKKVPAKESEYGLGRDLQVEAEETRDEPKPITYTEMIGSATTFVTDKAVATKNIVASSLGYSGGDPVGSAESPENVTEKLSNDDKNVKEIGSSAKLPLSGGGSVGEETEQVEDKGVSARDYMAEKLKPGEDDKALSEMITEKLQLGRRGEEKKIKDVEVASEKILSDKTSEENKDGDVVGEEEKGGVGMVGKIKGVYNYWVGGTTEEVKPKSPVSVDETSQSLGSTVGTKGFSDSGENGLGKTGGSTGVVPLHKGL
ncbi:unnamed protein product [Cochlearia groenlandica]